MILPIATHCYRDTRPYGTYLLVAVNVAVFLAGLAGTVPPEGWHSNWSELDWVAGMRSQFSHADAWHLGGNLIALWIFGQAVEGAVGTRGFLLWLLGVLLCTTVVEHYAFGRIAEAPGSLGASGLVYACIAAGFLLAPKTRMTVVYTVSYAPRTVEVGLPLLALGHVGLEIWRALSTYTTEVGGLLPYTPLLHVTGVAVGAALAYLGLRFGWLDAGGWDFFSRRELASIERRSGRAGHYVAPRVDAPPPPAEAPPKCKHCGRVRPAHLPRCMYCGEA
jgi:rhomboid family protein